MIVDTLAVYYKMGDIAQQIMGLELKEHENPSLENYPMVFNSPSLYITDMITFQWARLRILECLLHLPINSILSYMDLLNNTLCSQCAVKPTPCRKDWVANSLIDTIKGVLKDGVKEMD